MKKPFVISFILTIIISLFFFIIIFYQYTKTKHQYNESYFGVIEEKANLVAAMLNECNDSVYLVETNMYKSEMYVLKGFDNFDSLVKIINETYDGSFIEQIKLWLNKDKSWIGSSFISDIERPYFFTFNVDKENEIAVFSATDTSLVKCENERNFKMIIILFSISIIYIFGINFGIISWLKRKA